MKLDRNITLDGTGKYALIKLRVLQHLRDTDTEKLQAARVAIDLLERMGMIQWGHEGPGEQFFVMKYKDRFTHPALKAYAQAVDTEAAKRCDAELSEYAAEIAREALEAQRHGTRTPD